MLMARTSADKIIYFLLALALLLPAHLLAAMSSTDYYIYADNVGVGGALSTGGIYSVEDTVGESPAGVASSSIYEVRGGYQYMERGSMSLFISESALNLGTLSSSTVSIATTTATVTTDSSTGYTMSVGAVSGTSLAAVADGEVTTSSEEYGIAVSGVGAAFANERAIAATLALASSSTPVSGDATILTFKASMANGSAAGAYSQTVTVSATANF